MYTIESKPEGQFTLLNDGAFVADFLTLEDAEKAQKIVEGNKKVPTETWVDDGQGLEYPKGTDDYHSGEEKPLTFEQRFDAVLRHLSIKHGIHMPAHLAPKE